MGGVVGSHHKESEWHNVFARPKAITKYAEANYTTKYASKTKTIVVRRDTIFRIMVGSDDTTMDICEAIESSKSFDLHIKDEKSGKDSVIPRVDDITNPLNSRNWCCEVRLDSEADDDVEDVEVVVNVPPSASFGRHSIYFDHNHDGDPITMVYTVVIVFNPWSKNDVTFLRESDERNEFVLEESGVLFTGTEESVSMRDWNFAQFSWVAMEVVEMLVGDLPLADRADPVKLSRALAAKVNSQDDNGVLVGNWSGKFDGGIAPSQWTSSVQILYDYVQNNGKPVKYGQCWVFAGVLTSLLRCIGIPARPVTNYSSGHDTGLNKCIDRYFDAQGNLDAARSRDSVWNFHVWTEVWMDRPDLQPGRGGWQAVDATPQERSQGIYCTGPASLVAIRDGEDDLYDSRFLFAEVNADVRYWLPGEDGADEPFQLVRTDERVVGTKILTKAVGARREQEVTHLYKHREGSVEERAAVLHGLDARVGEGASGLDFKFTVDSDKVLGSSMKVSLEVDCQEGTPKTVRFAISVFATDYTGNEREMVRKFTGEKETPFKVSRTISAEDYESMVAAGGASIPFEFLCHAIVAGESNKSGGMQAFVESQKLALSAPSLDISIEDAPNNRVLLGEYATIRVTFKNPFGKPLKNGKLCAFGPGVTWGKEIGGEGPVSVVDVGDVPKGGELNETFEILADHLTGPVNLVVVYNSEALQGVNGSLDFLVMPEST